MCYSMYTLASIHIEWIPNIHTHTRTHGHTYYVFITHNHMSQYQHRAKERESVKWMQKHSQRSPYTLSYSAVERNVSVEQDTHNTYSTIDGHLAA